MRLRANATQSEQIGDLVNGATAGFVLLGEALGKLASIVVSFGFKGDDVTQSDAAVTTNAVRHDLAPVQ